jgi:NhaP-type Na+/H+ or K+/H+ antiporter
MNIFPYTLVGLYLYLPHLALSLSVKADGELDSHSHLRVKPKVWPGGAGVHKAARRGHPTFSARRDEKLVNEKKSSAGAHSVETVEEVQRRGRYLQPTPPPATGGHSREVPENGHDHFVLYNFAQHKAAMAQFVVIPVVVSMLVAFVLTNYLEEHHSYLSWLPEAMITISLGVIVGLVLDHYVPDYINAIDHGHFFASFSSCLLNLVLLPIIIFESGWNMRRKDFASQFTYCLLFAFLATSITAGLIGVFIMETGRAGWHSVTNARTSFAYGALMSATDPIASLSTYAALKVDPLLNTMVFGEAALNDSVAIVLFNLLNNDDVVAAMTSPSATAFKILSYMFYLFVGSASIGLLFGAIFCSVLKYSGLDTHYKVETLFIVMSCYITAASAEMVACSGIIAVFFEGFIMGVYARPHLSKAGSLMANFFVKQLVALSDTSVFLLMGVSVVRLTFKGFRFGACVMLFCIVSRYLSVFPVGWLVNYFKARNGRSMKLPEAAWGLLSNGHLMAMTHAGLRGAIAMVLSMELGDWVDQEEGAGTKQMLQNTTFLVIITLLLVFGGSTEWLLKFFDIPCGKDTSLDQLWLNEGKDMRLSKLCSYVDEHYLFPFLVGEDAEGLSKERDEEEDLAQLLAKEAHSLRGVRKTPVLFGAAALLAVPKSPRHRHKSPRHGSADTSQEHAQSASSLPDAESTTSPRHTDGWSATHGELIQGSVTHLHPSRTATHG